MRITMEERMPNNEIAYLSLVIAAFLTFAVCLAWVAWWSRRGEKRDIQSQPTAVRPVEDQARGQPQPSSRAA